MTNYANDFDKAVAGRYEAREADWRNGAVSYSVLVDRFAPAADIETKRHLYPAPKTLHSWSETPQQGLYLEDERLWSHEIAFWGGDLESLRNNLQYIADLGVQVLYLNPIVASYTNHKYDAIDFAEIAPEFGTRQAVKDLAAELHRRGMKLVLDGVFNHMGRNSEMFKDALSNADSPYRNWFYFGDQYPGGARSWALAENLPELNWENPAVQDYLYAKKDSIVRQYLRDGADGWRLDVAFDIGMKYLKQLTKAAHKEKQGSLVLGEIAQYPKEWFP